MCSTWLVSMLVIAGALALYLADWGDVMPEKITTKHIVIGSALVELGLIALLIYSLRIKILPDKTTY